MMYPLVSELAADGIPVVVSCRVLKLARQPYYRWLRNPVTRRELEEAYRANALFNAHRDDPEFGYRLLADEARDEGEPMGRHGGSRHRTAGGVCSGRSGARTARSLALLFMTISVSSSTSMGVSVISSSRPGRTSSG